MKVECPVLSQFSSLKHAFFPGNPASLSIWRTHAIEGMTVHPLPLVTPKQVHGTTVLHVTEPWTDEREGDGLVTRSKGIALGIWTADCGPVLLYDPLAQVIGACHAGWRGATGGIIQATLKSMEDLGARRSQIYATLGPTIQQQNYEVGPEFPDLIEKPYETYFYPSKNAGHHQFDLPLYIQKILLKEGITNAHDVKVNTFTETFSSRRGLSSLDNLSAIAML
jgi:YfiH family protein